MHLIHCTQKLLKELAVPMADLSEYPETTEGIGNWYANLFRIERRKCILFTNEKTLYSFVVPKVLKKDIVHIRQIFLNHLISNLMSERLPNELIARLRDEYREIGFAKTASRSILGSMNDLTMQYEFRAYEKGGIDNVGLSEANHALNRNLLSALKYKYPIDALKELLKEF